MVVKECNNARKAHTVSAYHSSIFATLTVMAHRNALTRYVLLVHVQVQHTYTNSYYLKYHHTHPSSPALPCPLSSLVPYQHHGPQSKAESNTYVQKQTPINQSHQPITSESIVMRAPRRRCSMSTFSTPTILSPSPSVSVVLIETFTQPYNILHEYQPQTLHNT